MGDLWKDFEVGGEFAREILPGVWFRWLYRDEASRWCMEVGDGNERAVVYVTREEVLVERDTRALIARRLLELSAKWQRCANMLTDGTVRLLP